MNKMRTRRFYLAANCGLRSRNAIDHRLPGIPKLDWVDHSGGHENPRPGASTRQAPIGVSVVVLAHSASGPHKIRRYRAGRMLVCSTA